MPNDVAQPDTMSPAAAVGLVVVVYAAGEPAFVYDEAGRVAAPAAILDRAAVAVALAQASGALASLPPPEPPSFAERLHPAVAALASLGTPEAERAIVALGAAVELSNAAFEAAAPQFH